MTRKTGRKKTADTLEIETAPGEEPLKTIARLSLVPGVRHAEVAGAFAARAFGDNHTPTIMDNTEVLAEILKSAEAGDKSMPSRMLAAQAVTLDALFTEMTRRAGNNMGEYIDAADRYMRLALKAQSNCRITLEALAKLHQPREQTVKHVHVNDGGQAVVADEVHNHVQGGKNAKEGNQSHAAATEPACESNPLLSQDQEGNGVPITGSKGKEAMPNARRDKSRRT